MAQYKSLKQQCIDKGIWSPPPKGVPEYQWCHALLNNYTDRYLAKEKHVPTDEEYAKIQKELYGD